MGILSGKDLLSAKYTTAIITDAGSHAYFIPIKNVMGDFFLAEIEHELYCFKIDSTREKTYRHKGVRSFKMLFYDINHYMPLSPENNTMIENFLRDNKLPRINNLMLRALSHLGNKEHHDPQKFEEHNLKELFEEVAQQPTEYGAQAKNFITLFQNLGVARIVRPTKKVSEFLIDDLITTSPQFFGSVVQQYERTEGKHKRVTNQPKTGKTNWLLIIIIVMAVGMIIGALLYLNSTGTFSHLIPTLPGSLGPTLPGQTGGSKLTMTQIGTSYPTPKSLVDAIQAHQVSCTQLPDDAIKMVNDPTGGGVAGTCPK